MSVYLVTIGIMLSLFMSAIEATVVATAMPTIVSQLGGLAAYSWVFSAYMLTATATVPLYGKLSDLYGRRQIYFVAMALFLAGSILSGLSQSMSQLIAFRALQGLGAGGLMLATSLSSWAAALASFVVPGLGQALARAVWRGVLILASILSIAAMFVWRVQVIGYLQSTPAAMLSKAMELRPGFTVIVMGSAALVWLGNVWDAWLRASRRGGSPLLFVLILFAFFALGWQISEIDPARLVTDFPQAMRPLGQVIWPWKAAVVFPYLWYLLLLLVFRIFRL